jgi:amidophosphoribosyltransferase
MCGIVGILSIPNNNLKNDLIRAMTYLQHRGQDSAGVSTTENTGKIKMHKDLGLVSAVFSNQQAEKDEPFMGVGHVRYSTQGSIIREEAQPFYTNSPYGISLVHNGNLTNIRELKQYLLFKNRHINTNSDSEILLNVLAAEIEDSSTNIFDAVEKTMKLLEGSYSVIATIKGIGMIAFRDPSGPRPLCYGHSSINGYMFASESVAFTDTLYDTITDVEPGQCIWIQEDRQFQSNTPQKNTNKTPCLFEYIYFARLDSIIDGISVYEARIKMGECLANRIREQNIEIDVVIPVPETSRTYAIKVAEELNKPYREAFVKNRYIPRTFIMSNRDESSNRTKMVKMKLNTIGSEFLNKNVLIVDDSIVRGTTTRELVKLAKIAGARKIWIASAAPPIRYVNSLGINIPTQEELIAYNRSSVEIARELKCDGVIYNDLDIICGEIKQLDVNMFANGSIDGFEVSCFRGTYVPSLPFLSSRPP